jgi:hypothetical protein
MVFSSGGSNFTPWWAFKGMRLILAFTPFSNLDRAFAASGESLTPRMRIYSKVILF